MLVDTSVWSLGLRRRRRDLNPEEKKIYFRWQELLIKGQACLVGSIMQETLSGIVTAEQFESVKNRLVLVKELQVDIDTHILAAEFYNHCRSKGISPEAIDMTLCAAPHTHHTPIFTTDPDFPRYQKYLPIILF